MSAFPKIGDKVKILAGTHLGKTGIVKDVDSSATSPLLVDVELGPRRMDYTPDEVEVVSETSQFELEINFEHGEEVKIVCTYPKGKAIAAIHALRKMGTTQGIAGLLKANQDDPSVAESLVKAGISFDDDDDEDWDDR